MKKITFSYKNAIMIVIVITFNVIFFRSANLGALWPAMIGVLSFQAAIFSLVRRSMKIKEMARKGDIMVSDTLNRHVFTMPATIYYDLKKIPWKDAYNYWHQAKQVLIAVFKMFVKIGLLVPASIFWFIVLLYLVNPDLIIPIPSEIRITDIASVFYTVFGFLLFTTAMYLLIYPAKNGVHSVFKKHFDRLFRAVLPEDLKKEESLKISTEYR